ncbi:MAG: HAMP domain-containing sensor histidine kinase [Acidimicrobiia bacterium]|nr:HAMP domain-containing sensor histidine kinase [Acidimicrobiia bacterium]
MRRQVLWSALAVAAVTLLAGLVAGAAIGRSLIDESESELLRQAEATATLVTSSLRDSLPAGQQADTAQIVRTLEIARAIGGHDFVEARLQWGENNRPIAATLPETPLLDTLGDDPPLDEVIETVVDGEPVLAYVRSVPLGLRRGGRILIAIGRTEPLLATNVLVRPLLFSLGIGAILAVFLAAAVARRVGRRLDELGEASSQLAAGDFEVRAPDYGKDDVDRLGGAFNEMVARLADSRRRERDFLMSVGHDLRTPLTTLRGYAEALDAGEIDDGDLQRVGEVMRRQTDRLSRLIEDLTLLSRLEAREFTLRPELVDIAAHVGGLVDVQRARAAEIHVDLLSEVAALGEIEIDPDRVDQILGNLIDNALRYTPEGGTVVVELTGDDREIVLSVSDTGPGIDPEDLGRVFERLYVAQRYRPVRPEGSGLGLTIVKELVEAMGGSVSVSSILGRGTGVTVNLPMSGEPG